MPEAKICGIGAARNVSIILRILKSGDTFSNYPDEGAHNLDLCRLPSSIRVLKMI